MLYQIEMKKKEVSILSPITGKVISCNSDGLVHITDAADIELIENVKNVWLSIFGLTGDSVKEFIRKQESLTLESFRQGGSSCCSEKTSDSKEIKRPLSRWSGLITTDELSKESFERLFNIPSEPKDFEISNEGLVKGAPMDSLEVKIEIEKWAKEKGIEKWVYLNGRIWQVIKKDGEWVIDLNPGEVKFKCSLGWISKYIQMPSCIGELTDLVIDKYGIPKDENEKVDYEVKVIGESVYVTFKNGIDFQIFRCGGTRVGMKCEKKSPIELDIIKYREIAIAEFKKHLGHLLYDVTADSNSVVLTFENGNKIEGTSINNEVISCRTLAQTKLIATKEDTKNYNNQVKKEFRHHFCLEITQKDGFIIVHKKGKKYFEINPNGVIIVNGEFDIKAEDILTVLNLKKPL